MKIEEAIQYITHHAFISDDVKNMTIEALEKQIPKKVTGIFKIDNMIKGGQCPLCNMTINSMEFRLYCDCGQKLDWIVEKRQK